MRRKVLLGVGTAVFVATFLVVDAALMRARRLRVEIDAPGTVFHFPDGSAPRSDRLHLLLDPEDETLFAGPPPVDHESIDAWLSGTWPGRRCVLVCERTEIPPGELTGHVVRFLVDDDTIPNPRGLLIAVGGVGEPLRGTVLLTGGVQNTMGSKNWGRTRTSERLSEGVHTWFRETRFYPTEGVRALGLTTYYGAATVFDDPSSARPLLGRVAAVVEGFPDERVQSIADAIAAMGGSSSRTWCLTVRYQREETPLFLVVQIDGTTMQCTAASTSPALVTELQRVVGTRAAPR